MAAQGREKAHISGQAPRDRRVGLMRISRRLLGEAFCEFHHSLTIFLRLDATEILNEFKPLADKLIRVFPRHLCISGQ
jgi:hypothetical protein